MASLSKMPLDTSSTRGHRYVQLEQDFHKDFSLIGNNVPLSKTLRRDSGNWEAWGRVLFMGTEEKKHSVFQCFPFCFSPFPLPHRPMSIHSPQPEEFASLSDTIEVSAHKRKQRSDAWNMMQSSEKPIQEKFQRNFSLGQWPNSVPSDVWYTERL